MRPVLHLSLNMLTVNPNLYLTLLLAPSALKMVEKEIHSSNLSHIHQSDNGETPVIARLQMLQVSANGVISKDIADMDNQKEMEHFAGNLPKYFLALYNESNDVPGLENKFKGIPPTFAISDVSIYASTVRMIC